MRFNILIIVLAFSYIGKAEAQVQKSIPGYLGSRNALSIKMMPNLTFDAQFFQQIVTPNFLISYERALNRRSSFTISAGRARSLFDGDGVVRFRNSRKNNLFVTVSGKPLKVIDCEGYMYYENTSFSIAKSYYSLRKGSIAPQGKFFKLGLTFNFMKIKEDSFEYKVYDGQKDVKYYNPGKTYNTQSLGSVNMEFGSKRFITRRLFFQKAFAFNMPFNFWTTSRAKTFYNIEDYNETNLPFFVSVVQTLNFSLAFGCAF